MHSITKWNSSRRPNYETNVDKKYPYSEVPYIGNYYLLKIPIEGLIDHIDYWGEGKIENDQGISGFSDCYNVNHPYQRVSNGPDTDKKIPNRIPVISYTNCNTSSYISDDSVKMVTLMGAPINKSCAADIARIVNKDFGKVIVYGFQENAFGIKNLHEALSEKELIYCPGYTLTGALKYVTLFSDYRAYLNKTELLTVVLKQVTESDYNNAVTIMKYLYNNNKTNIISDIVTKLLKEGKTNTIQYAHKLWSDEQNIVQDYFPVAFKSIFQEKSVKLIDKEYLLALKLDANVDETTERPAWGDSKDKISKRVEWKIIPINDNETNYFKILNTEHGIYLKLSDEDNPEGRQAKGANTENIETDQKFQWYLEPIKLDDDVLFFITNRHFKQSLKLNEATDKYEDRLLLGCELVYDNPERFGWFIVPFN